MKPLFTLILLLLSLTIISCDDASLITREAIQDVGSCFESAETTDDLYIVSLDRNCVDTELSIPPPIPTDPTAQPTVIEREWELISTLERDLYQKDWHKFHVYDHDEQKLLKAFREGKDFLFEIVPSEGFQLGKPWQYYYFQIEKPTTGKQLFFASTGWFDHWGPEGTPIGNFPIIRDSPGLKVVFDIGFEGSKFHHEKNQAKEWVLGDVEFSATRNGATKDRWVVSGYEPHIREWAVLKVYAR